MFTWRLIRTSSLTGLLLTIATLVATAQNTPEQKAAMLLAAARKAYNDKNFSFAATQFREFLKQYGNHKEANSARYGLALSLLDGEQRNYEQALEQLDQLNGVKDYPDRPFVLYYTGLARRGQGVTAMNTAAAKPNEATTHKNNARTRFDEAARSFGAAAKAFEERSKDEKSDKELPIDQEWAVRSRCDQAEMLLRLNKAREAKEAVTVVLEKKYDKSRYLTLGLYYHGFACFLLGEHLDAGKSLARTGVTSDETFGTHARYLLGRVHHLNNDQNEREEARTQYQAVLKDHESAKKTAQTTLHQQAAQLKNDPEKKARLERLVKGPVPDHVARATFFLGVLQYEDGRFGEAAEHFKNFATQHPTSPLAAEAKLRQGFCQVQLKQNDDAIKTLAPIAEKEAALADQALLWTAKAQANKADPAKPETYKTALATFEKAAAKANERVNNDPGAKLRRGEILAEQAEVQIAAKQYKESIVTYRDLVQNKLLPGREDEMTLNLATACQLAGDYTESDKVCSSFTEKHKDSTLLPSVLFRRAENSALQAIAAEKNQNLESKERAKEVAKHNDEAIKRYADLVEKYPEHANVNLARQGMGMAHYRKGELDKAQKALELIPAADRTGELAVVSYQLADVYLRQAPARADDAVAAGKLEEKLKGAADALEGFVAADANSPAAPDALIKLGFCQQRMAKLLAQPADQAKMLGAARATYERIQQKHAKHDLYPQATFERAKVIALQKDVNGAMNELKKFSTDPLKKTPIAPMALLHLSTLQRSQNRPADAVTTLAECRKEHEEALGKDPKRAAWVLQIRYHHAVALREAGKYDEARALFETVAKSSNDRPEAWDAALRAGQSQKEGGEKKIGDAQKKLADPNLKGEKRTAEEKNLADGVQSVRSAAQLLATQEKALAALKVTDEEAQKTLAKTRARMLYEAAWAWRSVAALEQEAARRKLQLDRWEKRRDEVAKATPKGQNPPPVAVPEVDVREVPVQPAETEARKQYRALVAAFPDVAINADARFELAELLGQRQEHDEAVKLLTGALEAEKEPSADLADRIKVRLAASLLDRGVRKQLDGQKKLSVKGLKDDEKKAAEKLVADGKKDVESALEQVQTVTANEKSAVLAHATYREAECLLHLGKTDDAVKLLAKFRDHGPFQNVAGLTDRALLRLGFALGEQKKWDLSRQAYERLTSSFGNSPWVHEARYGIAWARQQSAQNANQYDEAINVYNQVINALSTELAARAQLNVGVCRMAQKRYADAATAFLVVPYTYDYPELSGLALIEAARALSENKQTAQAVKLLRRVLKDYAGTEHAEAAKKRLTDLGEDS